MSKCITLFWESPAKQFEVDEIGEIFDRTFKTIATHKPKGKK